MKVQPKDERVHRFVGKLQRAPAYQWEDVPDPRHKRGRRWKLKELLNTLLMGLLTGTRALRGVESLTEDAQGGRLLTLKRRLPDTTLYRVIARLDPIALRQKLRAQVLLHFRAKRFEPQGVPCGVLTIDGKCIAVLSHDAQGQAQRHENNGRVHYLYRVLRAVLTSTPVRPCIDQQVIASDTNDMGAFADFWAALMSVYGSLEMFEVVTLDAGFCSLANATLVDASDRGYVISLKENQKELLHEAQRVLQPLMAGSPEAESFWEKAHGKEIRRRLYRTTEMEGYLDWSHLKQVWLVVQETRDKSGKVEVEERYFVTNLRTGRLSPKQTLQVVRGHWGIENDCNWTFDTQWHEDDVPWCTKGNALEVLGLLRVMAYNIIQVLRKRHLVVLRPDGTRESPPPFRRLFEWVKQALRLVGLGGLNSAKVV